MKYRIIKSGTIYQSRYTIEVMRFEMFDRVDWKTEGTGMLETVYKDGKLIKETTLSEIRERINR